jgi:hypothetical protein
VLLGTTWERISLRRRTGREYISEVRCGREGTAVLEEDISDSWSESRSPGGVEAGRANG